jgi:hypothetical protein
MRLFKLIASALILTIIVLFILQNVPTFKSPVTFSLDLYVHEKFSWEHYLYTLLLFSIGIGFLGGILLMLRPYFNVRRLLAQERQEKQQIMAGQPATDTPPSESPAES